MSAKCYMAFSLQASLPFISEQGISTKLLLNNTGLPPSILLDPYQQLTKEQDHRFFHNLLQTTGRGDLGLLLGNHSLLPGRMPDTGLSSAASNLQTFQLAQKLSKICCTHILYTRNVLNGVAINRLTLEEPNDPLGRFWLDRSLSTLAIGVKRLFGGRLQPIRINLPFAEQGKSELYHCWFPCPVYFEQPHCEIWYPDAEGGTPIATRDDRLHRSIQQLCDQLIEELTPSNQWDRDTYLILNQYQGSLPNCEQVAQKLGLSTRSLRRQLNFLGTNFQTIVDRVRRDRAIDHLSEGQLSVQQIGELCGFNDIKNFSHAFKRWTGFPPSHFRQSHEEATSIETAE